MKKIFLVIFIGSLLLCCSDKKSSVNSGTSINLEKETPVSISDLFESIDAVQLETNEQCLIQQISNVIFYDNRYYILDRGLQTLFCFDASGKFLFKINRKGQGPEEYLYIESFNIDTYEQTLLLLEPWGNLLAFDLDGKFISKTKLLKEILAYNEVYPLNRDTLIFTSLNKYALVMYSKNTKSIIDKRYEDVIQDCVFGPIGRTYTYNNQVFFSLPLSRDIINLSDNTVFSWDFGNKNNTQKQIEKIEKMSKAGDCAIKLKPGKMERRDVVGEKLINHDIAFNYETSRYKICLVDCGNDKCINVFFDKKTNKAHVFEKTTEGIQFLIPFYTAESIIITGMEQFHVYKYYDENILSEEQRKMIDSHKIDDNPFLIKYNLKH